MSIEYQVLGKPGKDNAAFVRINSGSKMYRLLFDCGEKTLDEISQQDVKNIDHLFFSHMHIDHVAGFDYFFRRNYDRLQPVFVWGPEETSDIIHHRLLGYKWNFTGDSGGNWFINEINGNSIKQFYIKFSDGFKKKNFVGKKEIKEKIFETKDFCVKRINLNHIITSIGYLISETPSHNINKEKLQNLNLPHGNWLEKVKDLSIDDSFKLKVNGKEFSLGEIRKTLLEISKGESLAYLTDFVLDETTKEKLTGFLEGCDTIICESQYLKEDSDLAAANYHLTAYQSAQIAADAKAKKLILFHLSERYKNEFKKILSEAEEIFTSVEFPENWQKH